MADVRVDLADAFDWLPDHDNEGAVVAMLPDAAELDMAPDDHYERWFCRAVQLCLATSADPTVFVQTDRKQRGHWLDKAALVEQVASDAGLPLIWHRIALRRGVGKIDLHRPTYSHMIAIGPGKPGPRAPDVIDGGPRAWENGVGIFAAAHVAQYLDSQKVDRIVNPFCGVGTFLQAGARHGIDGIGCDRDPDRVVAAQEPIVGAR